MANYISADIDFTSLCSMVLREYKEPVAGSNAVSLNLVEDMVNVVYYDFFNNPGLRSYARQGDHSFEVKEHQLLGAAVTAGDGTITLDDSSDWPATGRFAINGQDFVDFTANDLSTDLTVTGATVALDHNSGDPVQLGYSLPTDIDEQQVMSLTVNGAPHVLIPPSRYFNSFEEKTYGFTILEGYLYVNSSAESNALMTYQKKITLMSASTDKPDFIPNKWRYDILVSGTVERIGVRDDLRTGWDWHSENYKTKTRMCIAELNNRIKSAGPSRRPSIYD